MSDPDKLKRGRLPNTKVMKAWVGFDNGRPCMAAMTRSSVQTWSMSWDLENGRTFRFHAACAVLGFL